MRSPDSRRITRGRSPRNPIVPLNTLDFQSELASIAAAKPDAMFTFMPGGMGVNLVRQFRQAGSRRFHRHSCRHSPSMNRPCPAQKDAALGLCSVAPIWAHRLSTRRRTRHSSRRTRRPMAAFPRPIAFQAYDAALLIDSADPRREGQPVRQGWALRAALHQADFKSLRGAFSFNTNNYPIQDFYLTKVVKRPDRQVPDGDRSKGVHRLQGFLMPRIARSSADADVAATSLRLRAGRDRSDGRSAFSQSRS